MARHLKQRIFIYKEIIASRPFPVMFPQGEILVRNLSGDELDPRNLHRESLLHFVLFPAVVILYRDFVVGIGGC